MAHAQLWARTQSSSLMLLMKSWLSGRRQEPFGGARVQTEHQTQRHERDERLRIGAGLLGAARRATGPLFGSISRDSLAGWSGRRSEGDRMEHVLRPWL